MPLEGSVEQESCSLKLGRNKFIRILILAGYLSGFSSVAYAKEPKIEDKVDESFYYQEAMAEIAAGDSTEAIQLLDRALDADSKHGPSHLIRGRLYLEQGNQKKSRQDFTMASGNKDSSIRAKARIGLGDILRRMPKREWQAVQESFSIWIGGIFL